MLEEVEVTPFLHHGVVHRATRGGAVRAREPSAGLEIDLKIEPLLRGVEVGGLHHPRRYETERELKEVSVAHVAPGQLGSILAASVPLCRPALKAKPCGRARGARP